jgi:diguanylate cyclase (GGDEF)-like protein
MQTASGVDSQLYPNPENAPAPEPAARTVDSGTEQAAISELTAAAENFNAAFNTALYELEASRKLLKERAARIGELDASIAGINAALQTAVEEARRKDEAHAAETEALNRTIRDLEAEREQLRRKLAEQREALEAHAAEIVSLTARVTELTAELGTRTNELADYSAQVDTLSAELASVTEAGQQREAAHREETGRLQAELQSVSGELRTSQTRLQEASVELEARAGELTALKGRTAELEDALDAQTLQMHEEVEAHTRTCQELNDSISRISGDYDSLKAIHDELDAHVAKLENLNRALHDSSISENDVHRKIIAEKDAAISTLKARLEAAMRGAKDTSEDTDATEAMKANLQALEQRLQESEAQARDLTERAAAADRLETQVESLKRELQALREDGGAADASLAAPERRPDAGPAGPLNDREQFVARLDEVLAGPEQEKVRHTLMYILLDNFIRVRDEIGVLQSARVLDETHTIIETCCGESSVISRFGDCTFAVLCTDASPDEAQPTAERIRSDVEQHIFEIDGRTVVTSTSIGICALRGSDTDAEAVISRVDLACECARLSGGNQVVMNSAVSEELRLPDSHAHSAGIVDRILAENRLKIHYQPISNLKENSIDCFEVLTRVVDESSNVILPGEFFAMAVNSGKAIDVDRHVIECALWKLAEKPNPDVKLFIKLTQDSVASQDLPGWVSKKLDEYRINPGQLVFEVPEQVMERDLKNLAQLSRELNRIGCRIAIEHYRLETKPQHLHHIHPEYLKIDKGLVQNINKKGPGLAKVNEIMDLAKMNNLKTIAEGVETPACLAILWELGVTLAQGYLISEPSGSANFDVFNGGSSDEVANHGKAVFTIS